MKRIFLTLFGIIFITNRLVFSTPIDTLREIGKYHDPLVWALPTGILFILDKPLTNYYLNEIEPKMNQLGFHRWMNDANLFNTLTGLYLLNGRIQNKKFQQLTVMGGEALLTSHFIAQGLKHLFGRERPLNATHPHNWGNLKMDLFGPYTSFPSSHATWYFSLSTILGKVIENETAGDLIGLTAFTLVVGHNHWISDMWIGYLLGKAIGLYVWEKYQKEDLSGHWLIMPYVGTGQGTTNGILFVKTW